MFAWSFEILKIESYVCRSWCWHRTKTQIPNGGDRRCLTEARVPSFNGEKIDKILPIRHFAYILRHNIAFLSVEIRNTCLNEASSVISLIRPFYRYMKQFKWSSCLDNFFLGLGEHVHADQDGDENQGDNDHTAHRSDDVEPLVRLLRLLWSLDNI